MNNQIIASVPEQSESDQSTIQESSAPFFKLLINSLCECLRFKKTPYSTIPTIKKGLEVPPQMDNVKGKKTLVIDLDETLVHSSFQKIDFPDFQFNLIMENIEYPIYVKVRPGAHQFLKDMALYYELIIFTASISEYADPVIDYLDPDHLVSLRLFRENCTIINNIFVKDLSTLNRNIKNIIIIDNSPNSFMLQPLNAIHIYNYYNDPNDQELNFISPFLVILNDVINNFKYSTILQFYDVRPVHEWWYKYVHFDKFAYTNQKGQKVIYEAQVPSQDVSQDKLSEASVTETIRNREPEIKITSPKLNDFQKLLAIRKRYQPSQTISKNVSNRSGAIHSNIEFNVELDEKLLRISTEGGEAIKKSNNQDEETEIESDLRNHLNINSPHGLETTTRKLFMSVHKQEEEKNNTPA